MKWGVLVASTVLVTGIASCNGGCNCNAANEKDLEGRCPDAQHEQQAAREDQRLEDSAAS